ncbi:radical SAM domain protein [Bacteroides fluxus YIT 12057]|uniref:Radical SAM domain protein n=1 Tax=Bacteroides fluxus YIT 12057 TaxID=763034 RepID=F3PS23_9BACE|nr:radical SAM domain protein [Bacteroides fluxus YIT 12057]
MNVNLYEQLQACIADSDNINNLDDETVDFLYKKKIIVEKDKDDLFLLNYQYETDRSTYSKNVLGLTIAPTLACNFSCSYCFEEHKRKISMDERTENAIISFINNHQESRELHLNWYGGEPLLAIGTIERLLDKITNGTTLKFTKHNLITNGFLVNDRVISLFKKYPLNVVQITLDGKRERHNLIRKTKADLPTYDKIIDNINRLLNEFDNTCVHVRVNIEKSNVGDYYEVANELRKMYDGKRLVVYPGFLRIDNEEKTAYSCRSMDRKDIAELMFDAVNKKVINESLYPQLFCSKTCAATRQCAYIVGPEGEVYKCWNDVGNPERVVGTIHGNKIINRTLLNKYIVGSKWYHDEACRKCFFLPICNGTCAWYVLRNKYENGKYDLCTCMQKSPGMLEKCLETYYEMNAE